MSNGKFGRTTETGRGGRKFSWGPERLATGESYFLPPISGGALAKNIVASFTAQDKNSGGSDPTVTLTLWHSPDGIAWKSHSTLIDGESVSAKPLLLVGDSDADTNGQLLDTLQLRLSIGATSTWVIGKVDAFLKPF